MRIEEVAGATVNRRTWSLCRREWVYWYNGIFVYFWRDGWFDVKEGCGHTLSKLAWPGSWAGQPQKAGNSSRVAVQNVKVNVNLLEPALV